MNEYLIQQNIHWQNKFYEEGLEREKTSEIIKLLKTKHIISILGVRRSGKSTVIKQIINHLIKQKTKRENILFLSLESPLTYEHRSNPLNL